MSEASPEQSYLTPEILAYLGRSVTRGPWVVTQRDIRRFTYAVGDHNPLWTDEAFASRTRYQSTIAPPFFYTALLLDEQPLEQLDQSGLGKGLALRLEVPVPGFVGAVAGGREVFFGVPIRAGDEITHENIIVDIYEKRGRVGPMIFITDEWIYRNQRGEEVVRSRDTVIRTK